MWRSLRRRIEGLPLASRLLPVRLEQDVRGLAVLFDRDWYLTRNPPAAEAQSDPLRHFLRIGAFQGRDPNPLFDCDWYLERYPDVRATGLNPLLHYATAGWREGRDPNMLFDTQLLLQTHPEIRASELDPLAYYLAHWNSGLRAPNPLFSSQWYLERYPDVRAAGLEPLGHYLHVGAAEGRSPGPLFDPHWYLTQQPPVPEAQSNPLGHFLRTGAFQGRDPNPLFDCDWYLERYPDVRAAGLNPLVHYTTAGWRERRDPNVLFDTELLLQMHPEIRDSGLDPLAYYLTHWESGLRPPTPVFRSRWYLERYPDVRDAGREPLGHYLHSGAAEGRSPNPLFDGKWYLEANPDVAAIGENPLVHYLRHGAAEGRPANHLIKGRWYLDRVSDAGEEPSEPSWSAAATPAATFGGGFDLLVDFSERAPAALERFLADRELQAQAGGLTLVGRPHASPDHAGAGRPPVMIASAPQALGAAIAAAASRGHHLLIVTSGTAPTLAALRKLIALFDADPMIGFVLPRLAQGEGVLPLLRPEGVEIATHDRAMLAQLPQLQLVPEFLGPCMVVRAELVANIPDFPSHFASAYGALHAIMTWSRRIGYRAAIANHVVVSIDERAGAYPQLARAERARLIDFFPDAAIAERRFKALPCHRRESWLGAPHGASTQRLLLDCSGVRPFHNGTSECVLGMLDGLAQLRPEWCIDVLMPDDAAAFHRVRERYDMFEISDAHAGRIYAAAARLSQPWTVQDIAALHNHARAIAFYIQDTISWDTIYATRHEVERAWRLIAAHADGLYYDSEFTMRRFNFRFPVAAHVRQDVTHLSFRFDEYRRAESALDRSQGHVLIIGNDHDHKGIDQALALLPNAFPRQQFVTIGARKSVHSNVRSMTSGLMSDDAIERLFAAARLIVYPSFYEGFGLPIVKGLSYGLDVVARRSELLHEVAANCAPRGRIVPFDDPGSMIAAVGKCLAGEAPDGLRLGDALAGRAPIGWRDVAQRILAGLIAIGASPRIETYDRRETALQSAAAPGQAHDWLSRMSP